MPGSATSFANNLPASLTSFVGRGREIVEVKRLLTTARLLTLTGAGGCGKTRLALRVAAEAGPDYDDGVWLAELAPLTDPGLVPLALGDVLGVREQPGRPLIQSIADELQARVTLLVLDNCEHLIDSCAQLAVSLLTQCPDLRILATSREPLRVPGEVVWVVPPLSTPAPDLGADASRLLDYEAVRLFLDRAAAGAPTLNLSSANAAPIAEICRRLDGIPLAIELAAARVRTLAVEQIAERLATHGPFRLLAAGSRTAPPRHQTLEAALSWSYDLLSDTERSVLQRLSVFAGGCTLEAAEEVCSSHSLQPADVLDPLSRLVEKSLVIAEAFEGGARYRLLETIRQYAGMMLEEAGVIAEARGRHLGHYLAWAEEASSRLETADQLRWLGLLEAEHDNLRAALDWAEAQPEEAGRCLRLAIACARFWRQHAHFQEGRSRLAAAIARGNPSLDPRARAQALYWSAELAYVQSDFLVARSMAEASLAIWRKEAPGHMEGIASCLDVLGEVATQVGDYAAAPGLFEEALRIFRELGNDREIGYMLVMLGWAAMRIGNYPKARAYFEEVLSPMRRPGNLPLLALVQSGMGELAVRLGEFERAVAHLEESLALSRAQGNKWVMGTVLGSLGWVAMARREFPHMRAYLADSLDLRMEIGDRGGAAWCLEKLAASSSLIADSLPAKARGEMQQRAVQILGAAGALREPVNSVIDSADRPEYDRTVEELRRALGADAFAAAWRDGRAMSLPDAAHYALHDPQPSFPETARAQKEKFGGLTERERQVAAWIAQGKSNREIAGEMVVGTRTVETYVTRILNRLGFNSRVQIATWAIERGLMPPRATPGP